MQIKYYLINIQRKRLLIGLALLFFIIIPTVFITLKYARSTAAAWFNDDWKFRKAINIPSHTTTENNVYVTVPSFDATDTTRFQSDCGDLRFTKVNGELLPYYVVNCNSTATVHVEFDTLPAGASTYYMYYGNAGAPNGFSSTDFATAATGLGTLTLGSEEKTPGPVAYWKFDEGYGTTTTDSSPVKIVGTFAGAASKQPVWQTEDMCVSGKCLYFEGTNANITVSNTISNVRTISFWEKNASSSGTIPLLKLTSSANVSITSGNTITATGFTSATVYVNGVAGSTVSANVWNHIEITDNADTSANAIVLGTINSSSYFKGFLDNVKLYNYARDINQIKQDYNSKTSASSHESGTVIGASTTDYLNNGLVGYWKMDENGKGSARIDSSGNSITLTDTNIVATASGKFADGGDFHSASSQYDYVADNSTLSITGSLTLSAWINPRSVSAGTYNIIAKWDGADQSYRLMQDGDEIRIEIGSSGNYVETTASNLSAGTWYHVAGVFDASTQTAKVYINGSEATSSITGTIPSSIADGTGRFHIGAQDSTGGATGFYDGIIDEARVYSRAKTPAEVSRLYNWAPGPFGYWKLDEGNGNKAYDSSGSNITGTLGNTTTVLWKTGKFGTGIEAGNADSTDKITLSNVASVKSLYAFTTEAWVYPTSKGTAGKGRYFYAENSSIAAGVGRNTVGVANNNFGCGAGVFVALFYSASDPNGSVVLCDPTVFTLNKWYHVAAVYNSNTDVHKLYVNGVLVTSLSQAALVMDPSNPKNTPVLGSWNQSASAGYAFPGTFDEVKLYNYERTPSQIIEDMNGGDPAPGGSVGSAFGWWKFDEGYSNIAHNSGNSGSAADGTLSGTSLPVWTQNGKFGKALLFSTSANNSVNLTNTVSVKGMSTFTYSAWVNPASLPSSGNNYDIITEPVADSVNYLRSQIELGNNLNGCTATSFNFRFRAGDSSSTEYDVCGKNTPVTGNWYHVVGVFDSTTGIHKLYINGQEEASLSQNVSAIANTNPNVVPRIGTYANGNSRWDGYIDEVKIFGLALTANQVKLLYNQGQSVVMGAISTASSSATITSSARSYCPPGDTNTCNPPVGEWNFEEGSGNTAYDSSGNGKDATATSTTAIVTGKIGKARKTSSSSDQLTFSAINTPSAYTAEAWANFPLPTTTDGWRTLLSHNGGTYHQILVDVSGYIGVYNAAWYSSGFNTNTLDPGWHHISSVGSGSSTLFYIDGVYIGTSSSKISTSDFSSIGNYTNGGGQWFGSFDQVRIFDYARTPAQIAWDYNKGAPVAQYKFDECSGTVAHNAARSANYTTTMDATITPNTGRTAGSCNSGVSTEIWNGGTTGKYSASLEFDGAGDAATISATSTLGLTAGGTISAWIYPHSSGGGTFGRIIDKSDSYGGGHGYSIYMDNGQTVSAFINNSTKLSANGSNPVPYNQWTHIVFTFDGTSRNFYVNGKLNNSDNDTGLPPSISLGVTIGNRQGGTDRAFDGQIDDVRIYNYALTPTQIMTVYNNGAVNFGPVTGSP